MPRPPSAGVGARYEVPVGAVLVPGAPGAIGAAGAPGAYVLGVSAGTVGGAAVGGPIMAGADRVVEGDDITGGWLMSPGPGNVRDSGAGLVAHDEHPPQELE